MAAGIGRLSAAGPRGWAGLTDSGGVAALGLGGSGVARCLGGRRSRGRRDPRPPRLCPALPAAVLGLCVPLAREATVTRGAHRGMEEGELGCRCWEAGGAHPWSPLRGSAASPPRYMSQFKKPQCPSMARADMFGCVTYYILRYVTPMPSFCKWFDLRIHQVANVLLIPPKCGFLYIHLVLQLSPLSSSFFPP